MNKNIIRRLLQTLVTLILQTAILFITAGTVRWNWAWIYVLIGVVILSINLMVLPRAVIEERGKKKENVKKWDKIITGINLVPTLGLFILAGLDHRLVWSGISDPCIHIIGLVMVFMGSMLFTWSMVVNTFFSTMVRIQDDRDHVVATGGPYRYVRHPGYVGYITMILGTPLALGSYMALSMSALVIMLLIIRTKLEDEVLQNELTGYMDYSKKVKYKLVPYLW